MKVVVLGAGIGGLTLGVALGRRGHHVVMLERREHFQDEGAGVVLGPNVMSAVQLLDHKPSEQTAKESILKHHLLPAFGAMPLDQISGVGVESLKDTRKSA